jgi:hypothetical protein
MSDFGDGEGPIFRTCRDCGKTLPLGDFHTSSHRKYGRGSYCQLRYNECHNIRGRENKIKNHGSTRNYHLKRRYKITDQEVRGSSWLSAAGVGSAARRTLNMSTTITSPARCVAFFVSIRK